MLLCSFQELNYTITINDVNGSIVIELGPYHLLGSGSSDILHHDISSRLLRDEEYSLMVTLATFSYVITSDSHYFGMNNYNETTL